MPEPSARVRVYVLTHLRPVLLRRALESLRAQTCTEWICELHNDAPADPAPAALVRELGDPRIYLHQHQSNLGPVATFNLAHAGAAEPFFSILEDDNWWEPNFLATLLSVFAARPDAELVWANMRVWRETSTGWNDTHETLWPVVAASHLSIAWPQLLQFDGPLHSNGAMLARSGRASTLQLPPTTPFDAMENLRERALHYPLVFVPESLANFAVTLQTARSSRLAPWVLAQALMGAAFLKHVPLSIAEQSRLWAARRTASPPATSALFLAALLQPTPGFLRHATAADWFRFARGCGRHPLATLAALRARRLRPALWSHYDAATAAACTRPQSIADIKPKSLSRRADLNALQ